MNTVTFNDSLPERCFTAKAQTEVCGSPLFLHDNLTGAKYSELVLDGKLSHDRLFAGILNDPDFLPFRAMRIWFESTYELSELIKGWKVWMVHQDRTLFLVFQMVLRDKRRGLPTFRICSTGLEGGKAMGFDSWMLNKRGEWDKPEVLSADEVNECVQAILCSVSHFLDCASSGAEFIAKVHPEPKGRSVEWVNARTHYVLLHKSHPANSKMVGAGQTVAESTEHLKRQAHSRRAHDRILRSPRFRHKVGQKIRIKACWVGPLEWKQGTSIYKMVTGQ